MYRHIESPGWKLSWKWSGREVIWDMRGAEATEQGNCSEYLGRPQLPHCCEREPVIVDLLPGTPYNMQVQNCCKSGVLSSLTQDPAKSMASFQMNIGSMGMMPYDFNIGLSGYTCGNATKVPATKYVFDNGRRKTQALGELNFKSLSHIITTYFLEVTDTNNIIRILLSKLVSFFEMHHAIIWLKPFICFGTLG